MSSGGNDASRLDEGLAILRLLDTDHVATDRLTPWIDRLLSGEERQRADRFRLPRLRHEHLCTRVLQRLTLSHVAGIDPAAWRFAAEPGHRPEIVAPDRFRPLRFSLSHTEGLIACAVTARFDVGVDIEHLDHAADVEAVASRFFAEAESAAILDLAPEERGRRFLRHWTIKEACYKALGLGLALPMDALRVETIDADRITVAFGPQIPSDPGDWQFIGTEPSSRHILALAIHRGERPDLRLDLDWLADL